MPTPSNTQAPPIRWTEEQIAQQAEVVPADVAAIDAYSRLGNPLLRAMYDAQVVEPDADA